MRRGAGARDEAGSTTVEFVILFPVLIALVLAMFEAGWLMTRYMMLDRGVDMVIRDLKLGRVAATHVDLKSRICDYAEVIVGCEDEMLLEIVLWEDVEADAAYPHGQAQCHDRSAAVAPTSSIAEVAPDRIVFLRACMLIDPMFRGIGVGFWLPNDPSGAHRMVSFGVFRTEPP